VKRLFKRLVSVLLYCSGLTLLLHKLLGRGGLHAPILTYHDVSDADPAAVTPANFQKQIEFLRQYYHPVSLQELAQALVNPKLALARKAVAVTFDDGLQAHHEVAFPILQRFRIPATFFVPTDYIGGVEMSDPKLGYASARSLEPGEITKLAQAGLSIGSHTCSHTIMTRLSPSQAEAEVLRSKEALEALTGSLVTLFAYPNGQRDDFDETHQRLLQEAGYEAACSTLWGSAHRPEDRYQLRRVRIDCYDALWDFRWKLAGRYDWLYLVHRWKSLGRRRKKRVERAA
jgi:peptidoglycan/xylan/chitin deacetylase (PgdA/CDA1 family)